VSSNRDKRALRFYVSAWLPVAIGITLITLESTSWFGADQTSTPLRRIYEALFGAVSDANWPPIHHLIRKCGHFVGYGLLCLTWLRAWWKVLRTFAFRRCALLALAGTALVASCDEWHQTYLPNRTGTPWDVLLDSCGGAATILLVYAYVRPFRAEKLNRVA
jgi:VanZ family protein